MTPAEEPRVLAALRSAAEQAIRQELTPAAAAEQFAEQARLVPTGDAASGISVRQQRWQTAAWWDWYLQEVEIREPPGSMLAEVAQSLRTLIRTRGLAGRYRQQPPLGRETHPDRRADQTADWVTAQWEDLETKDEMYISTETRLRVQARVDRILGSQSGRVLDVLCGGSSVFSTSDREVFGVGLAGGVLASRSDLAGYAVQDLNVQPSLPAGAAGLWDAAVISFGAPYLTRPVPVYRSIAEHLTPGAPLILVVSKRRYHAGLAIHAWNDPVGYGFASKDEAIAAYLRWAGFEDIAIEQMPDPYVISHEHEVEGEDTLSVIIARRRPAGAAGGDPAAPSVAGEKMVSDTNSGAAAAPSADEVLSVLSAFLREGFGPQAPSILEDLKHLPPQILDRAWRLSRQWEGTNHEFAGFLLVNLLVAYRRAQGEGDALSRVQLVGIPGRTSHPLVMKGRVDWIMALTHVLTNALQATRTSPDRTITIETGTDAGHDVIRIADTGPGIALEHRPKIFGPDFTTKSDYGGGRGLAIAKREVEQDGGTITVHSEIGVGTTVTIRLPAAPPDGTDEAATTEQMDGAVRSVKEGGNDP